MANPVTPDGEDTNLDGWLTVGFNPYADCDIAVERVLASLVNYSVDVHLRTGEIVRMEVTEVDHGAGVLCGNGENPETAEADPERMGIGYELNEIAKVVVL